MIDPGTALATASAAFTVLKKGFAVGRDIESMGKDLGRWMGAMSDLRKAEELAKNPPLFKRLIFKKSVEEEAMEAFMAKKKAEDMRNELRQIISLLRGPSAWDELVRMEGRIRKERQEAIYKQKERQKAMMEYSLAFVLIIIAAVGMYYFGTWLYDKYKITHGL